MEPLTEFQHDHVSLWGSPCGIIPTGEFQGLCRVAGVCAVQKPFLRSPEVYQAAHVGPMTAELVRPDVSGESWGHYDLDRLRIAGLARAVQTRLPYLHHCTPLYCLKDRAACRFFFPSVDGKGVAPPQG